MNTWHMKNYSVSQFIREMKSKTTLRYHLILTVVTGLKKAKQRLVRKDNTFTLLVVMKISIPIMESSMEFLQRTRHKYHILQQSHLRYICKTNEGNILKRFLYFLIYCDIIHITRYKAT